MNKKLIISILLILICTSSLNAQISSRPLLRDGCRLKTITGKLTGPDSNDVCVFELTSDTIEESIILGAGTKLELLRSSTLEKLITHSKNHQPLTYKLQDVKFTKYKGKNYIFPTRFIPVNPPIKSSAVQESDNAKSEPSETSPVEETEKKPAFIDMNDSLLMPPTVREKLNAARTQTERTGYRIVDSNIVTIDDAQQKLDKPKPVNVDSVLLDKTAVLVKKEDGEFNFALNSMGRNLEQASIRLLPCEVLEHTELSQSANPYPLRFKISGLVTKYKDNSYLLLYKATQIYSHGNLGR